MPACQVVLLGAAVNAIGHAATLSDLLVYPALFVAIMAASAVLAAIQEYCQASLEQRLSNAFNLKIASKACRLSLSDFESPEVYNRMKLATREATSRPYLLFAQIVATISGATSLLTVSLVLLRWNPVVALLIVLAPILPVVVDQVFTRRMWRIERGRAEERRKGEYLLALLTNDKTFKETRLFGLVRHFLGTYQEMLGRFLKIDLALERKRVAGSSFSGIVGLIVSGVAITLAVRDAFTSGDVGRLAAYLAAISAVNSAAQMLVGGVGQLFEHTLFLSNLFEYLDVEDAEGQETVRGLPLARADVREHSVLEFDKVCFAYPGEDDLALRDFSMQFEPSRTYALVGENGAGKSTIVKLLARLYRPTTGRILLGGVDVAELDLTEYRSRLGILFQDFTHYEATLRENVGYGRLESLDDDDEMFRALEVAGLGSLAKELDGGLDTQLGKWFESGRQLSGGQWQRVAIARTVFRRAEFLVLDEPTASLDAHGEESVFRALGTLPWQCARILISHRFSTVRMADEIVVLNDGRVVEQGGHADLLEREGLYSQMYRIQASAFQLEIPPVL
jgi:ATP-binding cassette subfamily B protein